MRETGFHALRIEGGRTVDTLDVVADVTRSASIAACTAQQGPIATRIALAAELARERTFVFYATFY